MSPCRRRSQKPIPNPPNLAPKPHQSSSSKYSKQNLPSQLIRAHSVSRTIPLWCSSHKTTRTPDVALATYYFPRTSLLLILTVDLHRTIEQAKATHPILNSRVKYRLAQLVPSCGITNIYCYHTIALIPLHSRQLSVGNFTTWWNSRRTPVQDTNPRHLS